MGFHVNEYMEVIQLSSQQLSEARKAQYNVLYKGLDQRDYTDLTSVLLSVSFSVLSIIFFKYTAASVTTSIASMLSSMGSGTAADLKELVKDGLIFLQNAEIMMLQHPNWDRIEMEVPFIHYRDEDIRFIQGEGTMIRVHDKNNKGWIYL